MFRFRLQRVLDLRAQREQELGMALAAARTAAESARLRCEALESVREAERAAIGESECSVGELRTLALALDCLDAHVAAAQDAAAAAERSVAQLQDDFTNAFQQRRVIDRLRERHHETWRTAEAQDDRDTMDDIALSRHQRPRDQGSHKDD
jgi:flagellar FliJ protein